LGGVVRGSSSPSHALRRLATTALLTLGLVTVALPSGASAAATQPNFQESTVFSGLNEPTAIRFASDGRVFVAEKSGLIKVFDSLSDTSPTQFADLRTQVHNYWDRGMLGLALDPNFPAAPYVYVLYTYDKDPFSATVPRWGTAGATSDPCPTPPGPTADGCVVSGRLSRLTAAGNVMTGTEHVLIEDWCQQYPSHSTGSLAFGQDGRLYVSGGDGASFTFIDYGQDGNPTNPCGDPPVPRGGAQTPPSAEGGALRSQDVRTSADPTGLDGSILRINPATGAGVPENPLSGSSDPNTRRIVATGLRNPFRFTIRPGTNEVWAGDVGFTVWEEINRLPAGSARNFGWPCWEGASYQWSYHTLGLSLCTQLQNSTGSAGDLVAGPATAPYYAYDHADKVVAGETCPTGSSSISGLAFYDGGPFPAAYDGALFFADYARGCIWVMRPGANGLPDPATLATFVTGVGAVDLQVGPDGALYYPDFDEGTVRRVQYFSDNRPPVAVATANPTSGPAPLTVAFTGSGSSDPDPGDTAALQYAWDLDGDGQYDDSTQPNPSHTYTQPSTYSASLRVTDPEGATGTATVVIQAGNTAPTPQIIGPAAGTKWRVGEEIAFAGAATDAQDGPLPASALDWDLVIHHCPSNCHPHQIQTFAGTASDSFHAPDHDYPSHLELELTATDSKGLQAATSVALDPRTVDLALASSPSGLELTLNATSSAAPFTTTVIEGSANSISAPSPQELEGLAYTWESWSDGGPRSHDVTAAASETYTATFAGPPSPVGTAPLVPQPSPPSLDLEAAAKKSQRPGRLAVTVSCPEEPCELSATGRARGVRFAPAQAQAELAPGVSQVIRLRATDQAALERLERRLEEGASAKAKIAVTGTDPTDGATATERVKVRLKP
jgi:glucose/arabinose dehydrogenase/PKD repeat protein